MNKGRTNAMKLYLNINDGEHRIECRLPNHGPEFRESMTAEQYEEFWDYHHPAVNDAGMSLADHRLYRRLMKQDSIQEQWFELA